MFQRLKYILILFQLAALAHTNLFMDQANVWHVQTTVSPKSSEAQNVHVLKDIIVQRIYHQIPSVKVRFVKTLFYCCILLIEKEPTALSRIQSSVSDESDEEVQSSSLNQNGRHRSSLRPRDETSSNSSSDNQWSSWLPWFLGAVLVILAIIIIFVILSRHSSISRKKQMSDLDVLDNYKQGA